MFVGSRRIEKGCPKYPLFLPRSCTVPMGLLQYAAMINALEGILGKKMDMVAEGSVKPFAQESIKRDKVLVYERA